MVDQIFYLLSAALLGIVIGALIMYFVSAKKNTDPDVAVAEAEQKLKTYKQEVSVHFEETADLIEDLSQSYKKVFDHLSGSAKQLMTEDEIQLQIEKRKNNKVTLAFLTEDEPLDKESDQSKPQAVVTQSELDAHEIEQQEVQDEKLTNNKTEDSEQTESAIK